MPDSDTAGSPRAPSNFRSALLRLGAVGALFGAANLALGVVCDFARTRAHAGDSGVINNARLAAPDLLILGSSRAKHHYDDELLSRLWGLRVFNTGQGGQGIPFSRIVLEQVVAVKKPKAIIIDVMLFDKAMDRVHVLDPWYHESPILRSLPLDDSDSGKAKAPWKTKMLMHLPAYRYAGSAWSTIKDTRKPTKDYGFAPIPTGTPMAHEALAAEPKQSRWLIPQLDALVEESRATGAEVILCFSPMKTTNCDKAIVAPVREYARAKGIAFLTFGEATHPQLNDESHFKDTWHLNAKGARAFSEILAVEAAKHLPRTFGANRAP